ncbi:glutathione transporter [Mycena floridula]|nr:glutathione transporter [Mycena floridula]
MEESKTYINGSTEFVLPDSTRRRSRVAPDVPEDVMEHLNDPNFDMKKMLDAPSEKKRGYTPSDGDAESHRYASSRAESRNSNDIEFDDESPYPEVRAAVSSVDDPLIPVNTFRMWVIGLFVSIVVSSMNQLFSMRFPGVFITGIVVQLISLPLGKGLEAILPRKQFKTFGYVWSFNPGPFSIKEHVCITVMANVSVAGAYATEIIGAQRIFYNQVVPYSYAFCIAVGTQVLGFSLGGLLRPFVVWPSSMIWPGALVNSALFNTLHKNFGTQDKGHITRERFFLFAMAASFVWYFVPGYLFTALSVFNWVCWIAPNNVTINALFGTNTGLGMSMLTFDWAMISYVGSPLVIPWWAQVNTVISMVVLFWILCPILYFTNTFYTAYLPISTYLSWDNTGAMYDASAVMTDGLFDVAKYEAYSPVMIGASLCIAYGAAFAAFTSIVVHTFLWFRRDIARRFTTSLQDERDVHSRLMQAYPEVPHYWYLAVGVVSFVLTVVGIHLFPTQFPVWGVVVAFLFAAVLALPAAMLQAITNQTIPLQVFHELFAGYILPGRPIANMLYKTTAFIGTTQAVGFAGDLKLGHYMKIPPRTMFTVQVAAAAVSSIATVSVQAWILDNIEDVCTPSQKHGFVCPGTNQFGTASLIWGGVGPSRMFSPGSLYNPLLWFLLIGAVLPIPFYLLARRFPLSFWRYINIPVCFAGVSGIPPGSGTNYISWIIVGYIFNNFIRRFHFRWWMRYNYILSAALDSGVALSLIVMFFAIQLPTNGSELSWWGNNIWVNTADAAGVSRLMPTADQPLFGPQKW